MAGASRAAGAVAVAAWFAAAPCLADEGPRVAAVGGAVSVVRNFVAAFDRHDLNATMAFFSDTFREVFPDGNTIVGKPALRDHLALEFAAAPRVVIDVARLVGDDSTAAAELTFQPDPRLHTTPQYVYVFAVDGGRITSITVYGRSAEAQKASAQPVPTPSSHGIRLRADLWDRAMRGPLHAWH